MVRPSRAFACFAVLAPLLGGCGTTELRAWERSVVVVQTADEVPSAPNTLTSDGPVLPDGRVLSHPLVFVGSEAQPDQPRAVVLVSDAATDRDGRRYATLYPTETGLPAPVEVAFFVRDGNVVLEVPTSSGVVPWVRRDGTIRLIARERVWCFPQTEQHDVFASPHRTIDEQAASGAAQGWRGWR